MYQLRNAQTRKFTNQSFRYSLQVNVNNKFDLTGVYSTPHFLLNSKLLDTFSTNY